MTARGLTLLETLAVIVLLSLAAGFGLSTLRRVSESPGAVLSRLGQIDAQMRLTAQRDGPVEMTFDQTVRGTSARAALFRNDRVQELGTFRQRIVVHTEAASESIVYDTLGRTEDFSIRIEGSDRVLHIAGLTGWTWQSEIERVP